MRHRVSGSRRWFDSARTSVPVCRSLTKISASSLSSLATRLVARLENATYRPSPLIEGGADETDLIPLRAIACHAGPLDRSQPEILDKDIPGFVRVTWNQVVCQRAECDVATIAADVRAK